MHISRAVLFYDISVIHDRIRFVYIPAVDLGMLLTEEQLIFRLQF